MTAGGTAHEDDRRVPRPVWSGTLLQVLGRVFGSACTFAVLALCARGLSEHEFGRYTFYLALFGVLDALADFGTGHAAVRLTASDPGRLRAVLREARVLRLLTATGGLVLVAGLTEVYDEPGRVWIWAAALYPVTHALELTATVFKNRIAWRVPVLVRAFASALRLAAVGTLLLLDVESAPEILFATAAASASANLLLHLLSRRQLPPVAPADASSPGVLRSALPLGLGSLCAMGYFYVDNLFLRAISGEVELGRYNAGVRLLSFLIMIAQLASATALPWLVREVERGRISAALANLGQPLFAASGLVCGLLVPVAGEVLGLAFGERFEAGAPSFRWLLGAAAVIHVGAVFTTALVAVGAERSFLRVAAAGLLLNVAANALLVPRLGGEGAAIATLATEAFVAVAAGFALARAGFGPARVRPLAWAGGLATFALGAWVSGALIG